MTQHQNPANHKYADMSERDKMIYRQGYITALENAAYRLREHSVIPPPKDVRWTQELGENGEDAWLMDRAQRVRLGMYPDRFV